MSVRFATAGARRRQQAPEAAVVASIKQGCAMLGTWRPVTGYEGIYEVSLHGVIRRLAAGKGTRALRPLRPSIRTDGYMYVSLCAEGKARSFPIHRLVATAFLGPPSSDRFFTNHRDGNKVNNELSNLEWASRSENMKHAVREGLLVPVLPPRRKGEAHHMTSLTTAQVRVIRALRGKLPQAKIAQMFGVSQATVTNIQTRKTWAHVA